MVLILAHMRTKTMSYGTLKGHRKCDITDNRFKVRIRTRYANRNSDSEKDFIIIEITDNRQLPVI